MTEYEKLCTEVRDELKDQINQFAFGELDKNEMSWEQFASRLKEKKVPSKLVDSVSGSHHFEIWIAVSKDIDLCIFEKRQQSIATISFIYKDGFLKMKLATLLLQDKCIDAIRELYVVGQKVIDKYEKSFDSVIEEEKKRREEESAKAAEAYNAWMSSWMDRSGFGAFSDDRVYNNEMEEIKAYMRLLIDKQTELLKEYIDEKLKNR